MFITAIPSSLALVPGSLVRSRTSTPRCCAISSTPAEKFVERGLDTLEDALLHFRRLSREGINVEDSLATWDDPNDPRPRLLVLGSGWAAHALVKIIEADQYRLLVVSPRNYFVFTPMLAASSVGTVEYRSITEPMRAANPTAGFIEGVCVDIDTSKRIARVETALREDRRDATGVLGAEDTQERCYALNYDRLVYAVGTQSSDIGIPGVASHCFFLKGLQDARRFRQAVGDALERATQPSLTDDERRRILTFLVVGGGATGVELTGELCDFLRDAALARLYPQQALARVVLVHGGDELLPQFDADLRAKALASLRARGVKVRLGARVVEVPTPRRVVIRRCIEEPSGAVEECIEDEVSPIEEIACGMVVWAAGTGPVPLTERLLAQLDGISDEEKARGRVPVDAWLRAAGSGGRVLALGDCAVCGDGAGGELPQTAQVAAQQGAFAARMLNREYDLTHGCDPRGCAAPVSAAARGGDPAAWLRLRGAVDARPFEFLNLGLLAFLGGGEALSQLQLGDRRLLTEAGSVGFLLWRSVYIVKQVSLRTRVLVLFDVLKTTLFGRDVTRL